MLNAHYISPAVVIMESYRGANSLLEWNQERRRVVKSLYKSRSDRHYIAQNIKWIKNLDRQRAITLSQEEKS